MYDSLEHEDLSGKLVLVQPSLVARQMAVRTMFLDGMFMDERVHPIPIRRPGPLMGIAESGKNVGVITNGGLISPQSESQNSMPTPPPVNRSPDGGLKQIDPSKVRPIHPLVSLLELTARSLSLFTNVSFSSPHASKCSDGLHREPSPL